MLTVVKQEIRDVFQPAILRLGFISSHIFRISVGIEHLGHLSPVEPRAGCNVFEHLTVGKT